VPAVGHLEFFSHSPTGWIFAAQIRIAGDGRGYGHLTIANYGPQTRRSNK
jgi:hypothetical protein